MPGKPTYDRPYLTEETIEDSNSDPLELLCAYETAGERLYTIKKRTITIEEYVVEFRNWCCNEHILQGDDDS